MFSREIQPGSRPRNHMPNKSQMRRHARHPFEDVLRVTWKDTRGQLRKLKARCLDLSPEGARLETDTPIQSRTNIALDSARFGSLGTASVRHCARQGLKYAIGVEFTASLALAGEGRKRCLQQIQPPARDQS